MDKIQDVINGLLKFKKGFTGPQAACCKSEQRNLDKAIMLNNAIILIKHYQNDYIPLKNSVERLQTENKAWETRFDILTVEHEEVLEIIGEQQKMIERYQRAEIEALGGE